MQNKKKIETTVEFQLAIKIFNQFYFSIEYRLYKKHYLNFTQTPKLGVEMETSSTTDRSDFEERAFWRAF